MIERLVVVTEKERIEARDLPDEIAGYIAKEIPSSFLSEGIPLKDALKKCESVIIERAIKKYGSQREAARILRSRSSDNFKKDKEI